MRRWRMRSSSYTYWYIMHLIHSIHYLIHLIHYLIHTLLHLDEIHLVKQIPSKCKHIWTFSYSSLGEKCPYPLKPGAENVFAEIPPVGTLDWKSSVCHLGTVEDFEILPSEAGCKVPKELTQLPRPKSQNPQQCQGGIHLIFNLGYLLVVFWQKHFLHPEKGGTLKFKRFSPGLYSTVNLL